MTFYYNKEEGKIEKLEQLMQEAAKLIHKAYKHELTSSDITELELFLSREDVKKYLDEQYRNSLN